jgi:hypothetical protein
MVRMVGRPGDARVASTWQPPSWWSQSTRYSGLRQPTRWASPCPGREPPRTVVKRTPHPYKSATQNRWTIENATEAQTPWTGPDGELVDGGAAAAAANRRAADAVAVLEGLGRREGPGGSAHRVGPDFASTLRISGRGSQSKCGVSLKVRLSGSGRGVAARRGGQPRAGAHPEQGEREREEGAGTGEAESSAGKVRGGGDGGRCTPAGAAAALVAHGTDRGALRPLGARLRS